MDQRAAGKEVKRQNILEAAAGVFAEQGFLGTRVADIAVAAGVGKGTVYEYFASKEELLFAVHERINDEVSEVIATALEAGGSARQRLERLLELSATLVEKMVDQQGVAMEFWAACRGTAFQERLRETTVATYRTYREIIADIVREGQVNGEIRADVDPDTVGTFIISAHDGLGIQFFFDRKLDPSRVAADFSRVLVEGLTR